MTTAERIDALWRAHAEVKQREENARASAWMGTPQYIAGVPVSELTLEKYELLKANGSPFVCGGDPTDVLAWQAIWILSDEFKVGDTLARDNFFTKHAEAQIMGPLLDYFEAAFADSDLGGGKPSGIETYAAPTAHFVHMFAESYGWTVPQIMATPIGQLFQLARCIIKSKDNRAHFGSKSMEISAQIVRILNERAE